MHETNRTLATADNLKQRDGSFVCKWGYFSDITTGPFVSFGIESTNSGLFKKQNDQHTHVFYINAVDAGSCRV